MSVCADNRRASAVLNPGTIPDRLAIGARVASRRGGRASICGSRTTLLQQERLAPLVARGYEPAVVHEEARACIPAKQCVVVAGGTDRLGPFEPGHRLPQPVVHLRAEPGAVVLQMCLGAALPRDTRVVRPLVLVAQLRRQAQRLRKGPGRVG